ncbi:hypothetical protein A464_2146 [Salmonella bongori N268-08]|uniref:Uncharacterized protein n=1 Tax=Salmonella bongori N268-08 TaxID=1197719 RepID=S5MRI0_SALBN|nr:hypothetical protein A464_2146 [Salmonella bongori N268-08]
MVVDLSQELSPGVGPAKRMVQVFFNMLAYQQRYWDAEVLAAR